MKTFLKNIILTIFLLSLSFYPLSYNKVEAISWDRITAKAGAGFLICYGASYASGWLKKLQSKMTSVPSTDDSNDASVLKECGLDYAANIIKQELLLEFIRSLKDWIKDPDGGFRFLEDPDQFLNNATDQFLANMIMNAGGGFLCSNFSILLKFAINIKFYNKHRLKRCTLDDMISNIENAFADLQNFYTHNGTLKESDYWTSLIRATSNDSNNVYGSYIQLSDDLKRLIGEENRKKMEDVNRNGGWMSIQKCQDPEDGTYTYGARARNCGVLYNDCIEQIDSGMNESTKSNIRNNCEKRKNQCLKKNKKECKYITPGSSLSEQVNATLGMERENLLLADEWDELLSLITTKLIESIYNPEKGLAGMNNGYFKGEAVFTGIPSFGLDSLDNTKNNIKDSYSTDGYEIEIKLYEASKRVLNRFLNFSQKLLNDWISKKDETIYIYKHNGKNDNYWILTNNTINSHMEIVRDLYSEASLVLKNIEDNIKKIKKNKKIIGEKLKELGGMVDKKEVVNLFKDSNGKTIPRPAIQQALRYYQKKSETWNKKANGHIVDYNQTGALRTGGLILSKDYLEKFIYDRNNLNVVSLGDRNKIVEDAEIKNSLSWNSLINTGEKTNYFTLIKDSYDPSMDIENLSNNRSNYKNSSINKQYVSYITKTTPAKTGSYEINNWLDFFKIEEKVILDPYDTKHGRKYLAILKNRIKNTDYNPNREKQFIYTYTNQFYSIPINHFAIYPNGIGDEKVNKIPGQGKYKTKSSEGFSWNTYKVFIPPFAKKLVIAFKQKEEEINYLYRLHLTYNSKNVDHRNVKTLKFVDSTTDSKYSSLKDLFFNRKTVLLNLINYNNSIAKELEPGINNMGIVLSENEIKKYIDDHKGGWLFIDIIKDNKAYGGSKQDITNHLNILYYIDIDRESESYKEWLKNAANFLEEYKPNVIDINS